MRRRKENEGRRVIIKKGEGRREGGEKEKKGKKKKNRHPPLKTTFQFSFLKADIHMGDTYLILRHFWVFLFYLQI